MAATKIGTIMICVKCQKQIKRNYNGIGDPMCYPCKIKQIKIDKKDFIFWKKKNKDQ